MSAGTRKASHLEPAFESWPCADGHLGPVLRPCPVVGEGFSLGESAEELRPDACPLAVDLLGRRPELAEQELGHRQGDLALAREDDIGPRLAEGRMLAQVGRAGEDEDLAGSAPGRGGSPRSLPCMLELLRIRATASSSAGLLERIAMRRVAVDGPDAPVGGDSRTVSRFSSMMIGSNSFSRSSRARVRPTGP